MSCPSFEELSADVDGALSPSEAKTIKDHLAGCERCRTQRAELLLLKSTVRGGAPRVEASVALKARLGELAARAPARRRRPIWIAAAVVMVAVGVVLLVRPWGSRAEAFAVQLVGDHVLNALNHEKPIEVASSDPATVEAWFAGKLDFAVKLPRLEGMALVGGRLCSIAGHRVALVFYDRDGKRMSLFLMDPSADPGHHPCAEGVNGFTVCRHHAHGVEYALVTDLPKSVAEPLLVAGLAE